MELVTVVERIVAEKKALQTGNNPLSERAMISIYRSRPIQQVLDDLHRRGQSILDVSSTDELIDNFERQLASVGLSKRALAKKTGLARSNLTHIFQRRTKDPSLDTVASIVAALDYPWFIKGARTHTGSVLIEAKGESDAKPQGGEEFEGDYDSNNADEPDDTLRHEDDNSSVEYEKESGYFTVDDEDAESENQSLDVDTDDIEGDEYQYTPEVDEPEEDDSSEYQYSADSSEYQYDPEAYHLSDDSTAVDEDKYVEDRYENDDEEYVDDEYEADSPEYEEAYAEETHGGHRYGGYSSRRSRARSVADEYRRRGKPLTHAQATRSQPAVDAEPIEKLPRNLHTGAIEKHQPKIAVKAAGVALGTAVVLPVTGWGLLYTTGAGILTAIAAAYSRDSHARDFMLYSGVSTAVSSISKAIYEYHKKNSK